MYMYEAPDAQLYYAVVENDLIKLKSIIDTGRNLDEFYFDEQNISTKSLLHVACEKGRHDCVKLFVDNNIDVHVRDKWGQSPLMYSISAGHLNVAELLLQKDADLVEDTDSYVKSALHIAAEQGFIEGIEILLKYGADVNHQMMEGSTPLMRAVCERDLEDCTDTVRTLIEGGTDVNIRDRRNKRSALQYAAIQKKVKTVELLLEAGADTNSLDGSGRTCLTNIMCQHVRNVQGVCSVPDDVMAIIVMLVQSGIDLSLNICEYCNPLMNASYLMAEPLIRFFLSHGADPNLTSVMGVSSLLISTSKNDMLSVKTFLEWNTRIAVPGLIYKRREDKEYTVDPFELAIMEGYFDIAKVFVSAGYQNYRKPYMYGKGDMPPKLAENPQMQQWLLDKCMSPDTLLNLVVFSLRKLFDKKVKDSVKELPLPCRVKGMIMLAELLDIREVN